MSDQMAGEIKALGEKIGLGNKVDRLEKDVQEMKTAMAVRDVQFKSIADGLKELKTGINRVLWVLGLALLGALAQFVLRGGLTMGGG